MAWGALDGCNGKAVVDWMIVDDRKEQDAGMDGMIPML